MLCHNKQYVLVPVYVPLKMQNMQLHNTKETILTDCVFTAALPPPQLVCRVNLYNFQIGDLIKSVFASAFQVFSSTDVPGATAVGKVH